MNSPYFVLVISSNTQWKNSDFTPLPPERISLVNSIWRKRTLAALKYNALTFMEKFQTSCSHQNSQNPTPHTSLQSVLPQFATEQLWTLLSDYCILSAQVLYTATWISEGGLQQDLAFTSYVDHHLKPDFDVLQSPEPPNPLIPLSCSLHPIIQTSQLWLQTATDFSCLSLIRTSDKQPFAETIRPDCPYPLCGKLI